LGSTWPQAAAVTAAVQIKIICGYGADETSVPGLITGCLAFLVAHLDQNRSAINESRGTFDKVPLGVDEIIDGFKYTGYPTEAVLCETPFGIASEIGSWRP
jgi:hypothetical protein